MFKMADSSPNGHETCWEVTITVVCKERGASTLAAPGTSGLVGLGRCAQYKTGVYAERRISLPHILPGLNQKATTELDCPDEFGYNHTDAHGRYRRIFAREIFSPCTLWVAEFAAAHFETDRMCSRWRFIRGCVRGGSSNCGAEWCRQIYAAPHPRHPHPSHSRLCFDPRQ